MTKKVSQGEDVTDVSTTSTVETDTSDISSNEKQTDQVTEESTSADDTEGTDTGSENYKIRLEKFRQQRDEARAEVEELKRGVNQPKEANPQKEQIKEVLKPILDELGYVSKEALERDKEDEFVKGELARLEQKYDGKDGRPKFDRNAVVKFAMQKKIGDIETAYEKLHFQELINWHVKETIAKSKGLRTESSDGSGTSGISNDDLKEAAAKGDKSALHTFLKRVTRSSEK
jgi:hypothetical protein